MPPALLSARLLPAILLSYRDPVPNIRFNVAKAVERLASARRLEAGAASSSAAMAVTALMGDSDDDVRFYAGKALAAMKAAGLAA